MNRTLISIIVLIVLLNAMPAGAGEVGREASSARPDDVAAIRAHIDSAYRAYIDRDREAVRATHHPDWVGFFRTSTSAVHGIDEYMKAAEGALTSSTKMTGYRMLEFHVIFHGDAALVTYISEISVQNGQNKSTTKMKALDVYMKQGDAWQQVAAHTASMPDPGEGDS